MIDAFVRRSEWAPYSLRIKPTPITQLLIAAARRCIQVLAQVGGTLLLIDGKDRRAADWYMSYGALEIPKAPLSLVLPYSVILDVMARAGKPIL